MALASLPLGITPASAAKVTEGTSSSIGVIEVSSDASQFNLKTQGASTVLVAKHGGSRGKSGGGDGRVPAFLQQLWALLGFSISRDIDKDTQPIIIID